MYKFLPLKLTLDDQEQLESILKQIAQIRINVNQQLDNLELKIYEKIEFLITNPLYDNLKQMESLLFANEVRDFNIQLTEIIKELAIFSETKRNEIKHKNEENLNLLNFTPVIRKFNEIQASFQHGIKNILQIIELNKPIINSKKQALAGTNNEIWKHKTFAKSGNNFFSFNFGNNYGTAESFLPLVNMILNGILITQLFKGTNQFDQYIDDQEKQVTFQLRIHEGINLSISIHDQNIKILHKEQKIINDCYLIEINEEIYLKQGQIYTISLISTFNESFNTFMFSGKSVSFGEIKFLNKETENIAQAISVKQSSTQSCISGLVFAK